MPKLRFYSITKEFQISKNLIFQKFSNSFAELQNDIYGKVMLEKMSNELQDLATYIHHNVTTFLLVWEHTLSIFKNTLSSNRERL